MGGEKEEGKEGRKRGKDDQEEAKSPVEIEHIGNFATIPGGPFPPTCFPSTRRHHDSKPSPLPLPLLDLPGLLPCIRYSSFLIASNSPSK